MKPIFILIFTLTLISTWYVAAKVILPNVESRITHVNNVLSGQPEYATYQYRIFQPVVGNGLETLLLPFTGSRPTSHRISYLFITFATFFAIYYLFYSFLRHFFTEKTSIIGILLLQAIIPLSVTGIYIEGDFITLLFYLICFSLVFAKKDIFLPVVIGLATLNREQMIFFVVFYLIYLYSIGKIFNKEYLKIVILCVAAYLFVFFGLRFYFGPKEGANVAELVWINNTNPVLLVQRILPLYLAEVGGFIILCLLAFGKSSIFFKLSFLSLGVYFVAFFFNGYLQELAKFLPAYLILIPMSLQVVTGEYIGKAPKGQFA